MISLAEYGSTKLATELLDFKPAAKYFAAMDCLIYLHEDCSYRAIRLDRLRTVLLHPTEDRPVGVKLKGSRFVVERYRNILKALNISSDALSLLALWESALTLDGPELMNQMDDDRRKNMVEGAKKLMADAAPVASEEIAFLQYAA